MNKVTIKPAKNPSPFYTKGIYLYALPVPLGLLVMTLWQMWRWGVFYEMASHLWEVVMIARLCLMLYLALVVSIGFLKWIDNKYS